ncbi:MAG: hypothetical protein Q9194_003297 [Teloschistes cf. exilis]
MAPNRPSQPLHARSTRVTRSQTRELSDSEGGQTGIKGGGRPKKKANAKSKNGAPQVQRANKDGPNTSDGEKSLGDVPEVDEHSHISYPDLPRTTVNADDLITKKVGVAQRKSIQNMRTSGNSSVFSGTTARTSRSAQEPSNAMSAGSLIDSLEDLSTISDKILNLSVPQEVSDGTLQSTRNRLYDPKCRESKSFKRHKDVYKTQRKEYGDSKYIEAEAIIKGLLDTPSYANDSLGSWRVDPVLYKANLVQLVMACDPDNIFEDAMTELDQMYPRPFLHRFVDATNVKRSPDSSALLMDTFQLAVDIRTYSFVENAKRSRNDPDFDPDQLLQRQFYRTSKTLNGWDVAGMRFDDIRQNPYLKKHILDRLDQLRDTFLDNEENHVDVPSLERHFSRSWLTTRLFHWCRLRSSEIETQLKALEGVNGIVYALDSMTTGNERASPSSHGRSTAAGHRSYGFESPQAPKSAISRLKELQARKDSLTTSAHSPAPKPNTLQPESAPARIRDRHLSPSRQASSDQVPPIDDDDNAIVSDTNRYTRPPKVAGNVTHQQKAEEVETNKDTPSKKRHFIDPQENAVHLSFSDTQDTAPATTSNVKATQTQSSAEESVSEDGGFQSDKRSVADRTRRSVPSTKTSRKGPAKSSRARRVQATPPSQDIAELDELDSVLARHNDTNVPTMSQIEVYKQANENARRAVRNLPKKPRTRTFWSEDETARLLELIEESGTKWAHLLELDEDHEDGAKLQSRDSGALKDKANNMKMDYLRSGRTLPTNFERIVVRGRQIDSLRDSNIEYDAETGYLRLSFRVVAPLDTRFLLFVSATRKASLLRGHTASLIIIINRHPSMASLNDICSALGFADDQPNSRGLPFELRLSLKSFAKEWSWIGDYRWLTDLYLQEKGLNIFPHSATYLNVLEDRTEIFELLSQAFALVCGHSIMADQSSESDEGQTTVSKAFIAPELPSDQSYAIKVSRDDRANQDATGAENDDMDFNSSDTFRSKVQIVRAINDWIKSHPERRVPVLARHDEASFQQSFAMEANLMATGESVWICRLGVVDTYQGWVLEQPDRSYVLVKSQYTRKHGHIYYAWIGGDGFDFSSEIIAHHRDHPKVMLSIKAYARKRGFDAEDVLNDHDISLSEREPEEAQEVEQPEPKEGGEVQDDSTSSLTTLTDVESRASLKDFQTPQNRRCQQFSSKFSAGGHIKTTTNHYPKAKSKVRKPISRSKYQDKNAPLKNLGVDNFPMTQAYVKSDSGTPCPMDSGTVVASLADDSNHFYTPAPGPNRHGTSLMPQYEPIAYPTPPDHKDPYYHQQSPTAGPLGHFPYSNAPDYHGVPGSTGTTTFHFYLSNPALGAIPKAYASIISKDKFFKEAMAAHQLLSSSSSNSTNSTNNNNNNNNTNTGAIIAASALVIGINRPIVVRKDAQGKTAWEELKRVVESIEKGGNGAEVEVTCIVGP